MKYQVFNLKLEQWRLILEHTRQTTPPSKLAPARLRRSGRDRRLIHPTSISEKESMGFCLLKPSLI